jgi:hypothetical protein
VKLHQLQLSYQSEQDRLLFRVSFTNAGQPLKEVRAWLMRKLVRKLWDGIVRAMETKVSLEQPLAAHARTEIVSMAYEASVSKNTQAGNFNRPFGEGAHEAAIGEEPILVTAVHIGINANRPLSINFCPSKGNGFEIAFSPEVLHGFCSLMQQVVRSAEWNIELTLPGASPADAAPKMLN